MIKDQSILRTLIWTLAFLGSCALFVLQVSVPFSCTFSYKIKCAPRVMFWLSSPHVTNIEEVSAQLLKFPSITICNVNPVLFSKVKLAGPFWPNRFGPPVLAQPIYPNRFDSTDLAHPLWPKRFSRTENPIYFLADEK